MSRRALTLLGTAGIATLFAITNAPLAAAHPLGNFTHNTYVAFTISPERIEVDHVLDLAEVPTFQERAAMDQNGDGSVSAREAADWARGRCSTAAEQIGGMTDDGKVTWGLSHSAVTFPIGQGGLPTTRLECTLGADVATATSFAAEVAVEAGHVGWHEVIARGEGVTLTSDVASTSSSERLTAYPLGVAPLDVTTAHLAWTTGAFPVVGVTDTSDAQRVSELSRAPVTATTPDTASATTPFGVDGAASAFTDLVSRQDVTFGFALVALAIAVGLGGLHALAPGHGKTLMAASLIGTGGRRRDAVVLGATVTGAHTAGVIALALVLSISSAVAPERAYPWLGLVSAVIAVGVGVSLFRQARRGGPAHGHTHDAHDHHSHAHQGHSHDTGDHENDRHGHDRHPPGGHDEHGHHAHPHPHSHAHAHPQGAVTLAAPARVVKAPAPASTRRPSTRRVVALGVAGGLVPSPSAVVVLLAGFALGRSWFALLLVVAFGLGMAGTLCITGLVVVRAGHLFERLGSGASAPRAVTVARRAMPLIAAATIVGAGVWIAIRSVLAM